MLYNRYPSWRYAVRRVLRGRKVCHTCWVYPGACTHMDKEVWEAINKAFKEGRIPVRKMPPRENNGD